MHVAHDVTELIGGEPLVQLNRISKPSEDNNFSAKQYEYFDCLQQLLDHNSQLSDYFYALSNLLLVALEDADLSARFEYLDHLQRRLLRYSDQLGKCFYTISDLLLAALEDSDFSAKHFEYLDCLQQRLLDYNDRLEKLCKVASSTAEALEAGELSFRQASSKTLRLLELPDFSLHEPL
jgi:hypothetical protein